MLEERKKEREKERKKEIYYKIVGI